MVRTQVTRLGLLLCSVLLATATVQAEQQYTVADLGSLDGYYSYANDTNNSGQGITSDDFFLDTASGDIQDLNDLIDPNTGWHLGSATAINDLGQIIVYGDRDNGGQLGSFLLTPVGLDSGPGPGPIPEPLTMLGLALGLGSIGTHLCRWRKRRTK